MRAIVYVDGFNLYYGALKATPYRWLDLEALCTRLLPRDEISLIRYFTARVTARPSDPDQPQRQQTYLRALRTSAWLSIHLGEFRTRRVRMARAQVPHHTVQVLKTEEKGSDVKLASYLLLDAFQGRCEVAVVISNDSDLKEPIRLAKNDLGVSVGVINPHPPEHRSRDLQATFFKQIRQGALRASQFPLVLNDATGEIHKPASW